MPPKVLLIAPKPPPFGGMANQACLLAHRLAGEGVQVMFVPTNQAPGLFSEKLWGLPVCRTLGKLFMYMRGLVRSVKQCSALHILACSHLYFYVNVIPALIIGRIFRKKVVLNYRGGEAESFFKGIAGYFVFLFRLADSLIVPSGYLKSVFHKLGIEAAIIPNISEIERFYFSVPDYDEQVKFICTRNFEPYYDIPTLIKSFGLVKAALPKASLTLIGDGSLKQAIVDSVHAAGLTQNVAFLGKVDPHEMPTQLCQHDIYANASIVDNYPISLLEAFASGLPVVSTAAGGIPHMVEHGVNGILVEPEDHEALAEQMISVAKDLELGRKLARNARRFADEHSWEKIWPKLEAVYQG